MRIIKYGIEDGINPALYTNPEFNYYQMEEIRLGIKHGIDVTPYLNPGIDNEEMERIRLELEGNK